MTEEVVKEEESSTMLFNDQMQYFFYKAAQWARFLGILGFILCGFMALGSFSIGSMVAANPTFSMLGELSGVFTFMYLALAVLMFFPALYLFQFGSKGKAGINSGNAATVTDAFSSMKSFFKFYGILAIVYISFCALGLVLVIILGGVMAAGM